MESTMTYLELLTRETDKPETELLTMAFKSGLRQLWREHTLGRYLRNKISRNVKPIDYEG